MHARQHAYLNKCDGIRRGAGTRRRTGGRQGRGWTKTVTGGKVCARVMSLEAGSERVSHERAGRVLYGRPEQLARPVLGAFRATRRAPARARPAAAKAGGSPKFRPPPPLPCAGRHPVPPEYAAAPQQPVQRGRAAGGTGVNSCRPSRGTSHFPSTPPCLSALDWPEDALCWRDPVHVGAAFAQPAMTAGAELE